MNKFKLNLIKILDNIFIFVLYIIFPISVIGGLAIAPLVFILIILFIATFNKKVNFSTIKKYKLEISLIAWSFITILWTQCKFQSTYTLTILTIFLILAFLFIENNVLLANTYQLIFNALIKSYICALFIFILEYYSNGFFSKTFRNNFTIFHLYWLDRGCCILSTLIWPIFAYLVYKQKKLHIIILLWISTTYILYLSDSSSSLLAFTCANLTILILLITRTKFIYYILILITGFSIIFFISLPYISINNFSNIISVSSIHRIFIWNFTLQNISKNILIGSGFGNSKCISNNLTKSSFIQYNEHLLSPLPSHPHNNILQIWLELGLIGIIIFLLILIKLFIITNSIKGENKSAFITCSIACLINYYIIGSISYNIWQLWWIGTMVLAVWLFSLIFYQTQKDYKQNLLNTN